ncbi:MAG: DUF2249 domain-containing protein [Chromatiales bacterium]|jgi:uncharacterized protein (DUF2249 family)
MKTTLDVSELYPPEPLERILDALADLPKTDCLLVLHRREPQPLYGMLESMGYRWQTHRTGPGRFEILIWPTSQGKSPPC